MTKVDVDANIHTLSGRDLLDKEDGQFREYRRQWKENPRNFVVSDFPLFLDIEVTSVCNLRCPFCATTYKADRIPKGYIAPELMKKIIDEGADNGLYGIKFNIRGEPLLHPEIDTFIKYAKTKGLIDVYFNTNLNLLTGEISHKLIDAGLDRISISIEGYTKEVYEKYRVGGSFEKLIKNLEQLIAVKDKRGVSHPEIRIQSVLIPELVDDLDKYRQFWGRFADEVAYIDYKEMKKKKKGIILDWGCPQLWQRMAVYFDGTIMPCNHDDEMLIRQGNANTDSIKDCWHSSNLSRIRELHQHGQSHKIDACDGCYLRDSEIAKRKTKIHT